MDLLALQGILKSLLQHHSSKASIVWDSAFLMVQLSHLYLTTGKTIALTIQTFVGKVTCLLFNMLSRFVIVFLSKSRQTCRLGKQTLEGHKQNLVLTGTQEKGAVAPIRD